MNRLERKAQDFIEEAWATLGDDHPLPAIFSGLMLAYYADESDLRWIEIAMRPWFADAERKSAKQEQEIVLAMLWLSVSHAEANRKAGAK